MAVQTEDHPIEYGGFEGTIPEGSYGGGTVMLWDRGTWEPQGDPKQMYEKGHLSFVLHGEKLKGGWHLVRTQRSAEKARPWLLFKAKDAAAKSGHDSLLQKRSKSVLSGRDLKGIAAATEVAQNADKKVAKKVAKKATQSSAAKRKAAPPKSPKRRTALSAAALPDDIEPELATLVAETPTGEEFVHEAKFDGYRVLSRIDGDDVRLMTRGGQDWTERMPSLKAGLGKLRVESAILDGEFVALDARGLSDFQLLQSSFSGKNQAPLIYYAFDLLYLDGVDLRAQPLIERKAKLRALLATLPKSEHTVRYSEHTVGHGAAFFAAAAKLGLEGVVSKRAQSPYRGGRGSDWQKSKSLARQEFVIVGFTEPGGGRSHLGALLLGVRKGEQLTYSGRVGTGFSERSLQNLKVRLTPLEIARPTLENAPTGAEVRSVHWVKPKLVAEVSYTGVTRDGLLRHPTFKGLREDKPASEVVLERPQRVASRARGKAGSAKAAESKNLIALSHPDKVLYPELGLTKGELGEYYEVVRDVMFPHVVNRPLTLLRCPEGRSKQCFFQKHPGESLAAGLKRVHAPASDGSSEYAAVDTPDGLRALVQMGALEVHIWGAQVPDADHPDCLVFDLDPDEGLDFSAVVRGAHAVRLLLEELGLQSWVKTTGGKGLHVTVPITPRADWDEVKAFSRGVAEELARREPERYVATMSKAKRQGKIFLDYLRNGRGATFIAPYSPRARAGAGIAMPIEWAQLTAKFKPDLFTVRSAAKYLAKRKEAPFASLLNARQALPSLGDLQGATEPKRRSRSK